MDSALRKVFLKMLRLDVDMADSAAVEADEALVEFCLHGPEAFAGVRRRWCLPMNQRILLEVLAREGQAPAEAFETGGVIDSACRCVCHCLIGSPCEYTQQTCEHCQLIA